LRILLENCFAAKMFNVTAEDIEFLANWMPAEPSARLLMPRVLMQDFTGYQQL